MGKPFVEATGVWLRALGDRLQVLVEVGGTWRVVIEENRDAKFSHIVEPGGILRAPHDELTKTEKVSG